MMMKGSSKKWYVLCTKPRNELKVTKHLTRIGIEVYTPTKIEVRQWSDRKKKVTIPLLPSMVLVHLLAKEVNLVFDVPGAVRFLFEHGKRASVLNEEVLAMKGYLETVVAQESKTVAVGDLVKVPLLEQEAVLLSVQGKKCLAQLQKIGAIVSFQLQ
jgi:transcriptional antiterminator RfaH